MESQWLIGILSAASGLIGALIGATASYSVMRMQQRHFERSDLQANLAVYLQAADQLFGEMLFIPQVTLNRLDRAVDSFVTRILGRAGIYWFVRLFQRVFVGHRWNELEDRFFAANARLWLIAPPHIRALLEEVEETLARWDEIDDQERARQWKSMRDRLRAAFVLA